jgi:large subunit ribosomal protein L1
VKVGLREFEDEKLVDNINSLAKALISKKPESLKGKYFLRGYLKSTMGPVVKLDMNHY